MTIECDCKLYMCEQSDGRGRKRLNKERLDVVDNCPIIAKCDIFKQAIKNILDSKRVKEPKDKTISVLINNMVQ